MKPQPDLPTWLPGLLIGRRVKWIRPRSETIAYLDQIQLR